MNPHPSTTTTTLKITKNLVKVGLNHPPPRFLTTNTPLKNGCSGGVRTPIQTMTTEPMERNVYTPRILSNYSADWNADTVLNVDFLRGWGVTWITGFVQPGYWRGNKNEHPITGSKWQKKSAQLYKGVWLMATGPSMLSKQLWRPPYLKKNQQTKTLTTTITPRRLSY